VEAVSFAWGVSCAKEEMEIRLHITTIRRGYVFIQASNIYAKIK
jgi:hypothetical protein